MTTMKTDPDERSLYRFLSEYGAELLGSGASCIRLEKNISRIARHYGRDTEIVIMPRHIHITVWSPGHDDAFTAISSISRKGISFNINTLLSRLSWHIADNKIDFEQSVKCFKRIISDRHQNPWAVLLAVSAANASFCRLFGGDISAMLIVAFATAVGYYIKQFTLRHKVDLRVVFLICSFVSAVLGSTGILFDIGSTPRIALATSILYLVPGIPFINSFSDMLYKYYICALGRLADALVLTACLSAGLCAAMLLMNISMF